MGLARRRGCPRGSRPGTIIPLVGVGTRMDWTPDPRIGRGGVERHRTAVRAALLTAAMGMALHPTPAAAQDGPGLDEVIGRAAAFVAVYVDELSHVLMEEDYQQTYYEDYSDAPAHSQLVSEFLLTRLNDDGQWVGFRDIVELNGRKLEDRGNRLAALFTDGGASAMAQVRRITEESARYNLGATRRTFNVPTYSLFFLHPTNVDRFRFERMLTGRAGCAGVETAWDVSFQEVGFPTIARGFQNISLPASGRFCLDPESGRVLETEFGLRHPRIGPRGGDRHHRPRDVRVRGAAESMGPHGDARQRVGGRRRAHGRHRPVPEPPAVRRHGVGEHGPAAGRERRPAVTAAKPSAVTP